MLDMLDRIVARAAGLVHSLRAAAHLHRARPAPRLFRAWLPLGGTLLLRGELPRADAELLILRTAWNCRCRYEWVQDVHLGMRAGLDAELVEAVPDGPDAEVWSERQRCLLRAADELHEHRRVGLTTVGLLHGTLRARDLIEVCILVGHYEMLAMLLNTRGVEPEPAAVARVRGRAAVGADDL